MGNDIKGIKDAYKDNNISCMQMLYVGLVCIIMAVPAMIWRVICGILFIICGILKLFTPRAKYIDSHKYEKCPKCGKEFTYYNHRAYEEGVSYTFCECGYDSREEE